MNFPEESERARLPQQLATAEAAGLMRLAQTQPELVYAFRHALIQEAAYASLTRHQRAEVHRLAGEALEQVYAGQLDELAVQLAHHFTAARSVEKAAAYARRAANRAVGQYAYDEAYELLEAARRLFAPEDTRRERLELLEALGDVQVLLRRGPEALALYQQALGLWQQVTDGPHSTTVRLHRKIVETFADIRWRVTAHDFAMQAAVAEASRASLRAELPLAEGTAVHAEQVRLLAALATHAWNIEDPPDWAASLRYAQAATGAAEHLADPLLLAEALGVLATAFFGAGRLRDYRDTAARRLALCRSAGFDNTHELTDALRDAGSAHMYAGEYHAAIPLLQEGAGLARRIQAVDQHYNVLVLESQCWFRLDRWDEVLRLEAAWQALAERFSPERMGLTCFIIGLGAAVRALRGEAALARAQRQTSRELMVAFTGPPEGWFRNQHY